MIRWLMVLCLLFPGCGRSNLPGVGTNLRAQPVSLPTHTGFPEPAEFSKWPAVVESPIQVGTVQTMLCRGLTPAEEAREKAEVKKHGPHNGNHIQVRVNEIGRSAFQAHQLIPVGSIVVKEKLDHGTDLHGYALMIKREPGYDPDNGNWQYVYVERHIKPQVVEGKLSHCIECHRGAKVTVYLFKFYLKEQP